MKREGERWREMERERDREREREGERERKREGQGEREGEGQGAGEREGERWREMERGAGSGREMGGRESDGERERERGRGILYPRVPYNSTIRSAWICQRAVCDGATRLVLIIAACIYYIDDAQVQGETICTVRRSVLEI